MKNETRIFACFVDFFLFNLVFFCLQLALTYSQTGNFISGVSLPFSVYLELIATLGIHLLLYLFLSMTQCILLMGIMKRTWHYFSSLQWQMIIWSLSVCAVLCANQRFFPLSIFSKIIEPLLPMMLTNLLLLLSVIGLSILLINSLLYKKSLLLIGLFLPVISLFLVFNKQLNPQLLPGTQPNLILLGIDSLSPSSVNQKNMPFLYQLLNNSVQFTDAISPLARTYPAWCSILTGLYPIHHHAYENLVANDSVNNKASMIWTLNQLGYSTIFATDDRRFNNLDIDFGFQRIIGPKFGINDVLLGSFNDFPLSNLLINFRISTVLFPYNYSNRASFFSYYPSTFSAKLERELTYSAAQKKPVFLAVHFELPHWPYAWAESLPEQINNEFSLENREELYQSALQKMDEQFAQFFAYLKEKKYFDNSIVIVLSDHGETLYHPNSRLTNYQNYQGSLPSPLAEYFKTKTATDLDKSAGHGSDLLSPKQYQSILAFQIYKQGSLVTSKAKIKSRVALIDIMPTLLAFLNQPVPKKIDGISLFQSIINPQLMLPERLFFMESGMFPNQSFSKEKAMAVGRQIYTINPTNDSLEIKPEALIKIERDKLYGAILGDWILVLYPDDDHYIAVIQNLADGHWIDNLFTPFAQTTPAAELANKMQIFYANKLAFPIPISNGIQN